MAVLPVYNTLVVPDANIYFRTDYYKSMTGRNPVQGDRVILLEALDRSPYIQIDGLEARRVPLLDGERGFVALDDGR